MSSLNSSMPWCAWITMSIGSTCGGGHTDVAISLSSIKRSGAPKPPVIMMYAVHGIGKTTFGACAPKPIFLQTEDGLGSIEADTFGIMKSYSDIMDAIGVLYNEKHDFKTVVLDSADWA